MTMTIEQVKQDALTMKKGEERHYTLNREPSRQEMSALMVWLSGQTKQVFAFKQRGVHIVLISVNVPSP